MNEKTEHEDIIKKINNIQQCLLYCIKNDCSHCEYRQYETTLYLNCIYHINNDIFDLLEKYKQLLLSYEEYRNNM